MFIWTIVILASVTWNIYNRQAKTRELASIEAHAHYEKDIALRNWASLHGGVYVPIEERTLT